MNEELVALVERYRVAYKNWRALVKEEREMRQNLIKDTEGNEPENLRDLLEEEVAKTGLRARQQAALSETKEAERLLFNFNVDHCEDPELKAELEHLAQDYAARITWLKQFLEEVEEEEEEEAFDEKDAEFDDEDFDEDFEEEL